MTILFETQYLTEMRTGVPRGENVHILSDVDEGSRTAICMLCGPVKVYRTSPSTAGSTSWICSTRQKEINRKAPSQQPEKKRALNLWRTYGLSGEDVARMLEDQRGCAICHRAEPGQRGVWAVDHDHACCPDSSNSSTPTCGKCVRGILCVSCNIALGHMKDDSEILRAAADYLDKKSQKIPQF